MLVNLNQLTPIEIDAIIDDIYESSQRIHSDTRASILRTLQAIKKNWHALPDPDFDHTEANIHDQKARIRAQVVTACGQTRFPKLPPTTDNEPPRFLIEAINIAQRTDPKHSQGLKLLSRRLHVLLYEYITLIGGAARGDILIPATAERNDNNTLPRVSATYPIARYWAQELFLKYGIEGILIAFLLWENTLINTFPKDWLEQTQAALHNSDEVPNDDSCMAISNIFDLLDHDYIEDKLVKLCRWTRSPTITHAELEGEVDIEWRDYLKSALWGALKNLGTQEIAEQIGGSPNVDHEKDQITDGDLVTLGVFFNELDWENAALVLETDDLPRVQIANALTNIPAMKILANSNQIKFRRALELAIDGGYISHDLPKVASETLPFNGPLRRIHSMYGQVRSTSKTPQKS